MTGWLWIIAGLGLAALELALPGWFCIGMAIPAGAIGIGLLLGLDLAFPYALILWSILSIVVWLVLRQTCGGSRGEKRIVTCDINDNARSGDLYGSGIDGAMPPPRATPNGEC